MKVAASPPSPTKDAATDPPTVEAEYIKTDILKELAHHDSQIPYAAECFLSYCFIKEYIP